MLRSPVMYLERQDFMADGSLSPQLLNEPTLVMFQADYCGHCKSAKPEFQALANEGVVRCMTVQGDGQRKSERDIVPILSTIYPGFRGYPSYMLFMPDGRRIPHMGRRDARALKQFVMSHI